MPVYPTNYYAPTPTSYRDVSRGSASLAGIQMPTMAIRSDAPNIKLDSHDLYAPFVDIFGQAHISAVSVVWYDGTRLELDAVSLVVQCDAFQESSTVSPFAEVERLSKSLTKSRRGEVFNKTITFGSCINMGSGVVVCPFALRVPTSLFGAYNSSNNVVIHTSAVYRATRRGSVEGPAEFEIRAQPYAIYVAPAPAPRSPDGSYPTPPASYPTPPSYY